MSNEKRNKKLAEWAGIKWKITERTYNHLEQDIWVFPDGTIKDEPPDFTDPEWGIALCFKWLPDIFHSIEFVYFPDRVKAVIWHQLEQYSGEAPKKQEALALCRAIEKLIDDK